MNKMLRNVQNQIIEIVNLPKIFSTLAADMPSGSILVNPQTGERAYWRLTRDLYALRKGPRSAREVAHKLAQELLAIVQSDQFKNHYGLRQAPQMPTEEKLTYQIRDLLYMNYARVEYSATRSTANNSLLETINTCVGPGVFLHAIRGSSERLNIEGIKGHLWLNGMVDVPQGGVKNDEYYKGAFELIIESPTLKLSEYMSESRLIDEIVKKIGATLPIMSKKPVVEFAEGQFSEFLARGLNELAKKHAGNPNSNSAKKAKKKQENEARQKQEATKPKEKKVQTASLSGAPTGDTSQQTAMQKAFGSVGRGMTSPIIHLEDPISISSMDEKELLKTLRGGDKVLTKEQFESMSMNAKGTYLAAMKESAKMPERHHIVKRVLQSGILQESFLEEGRGQLHDRWLATSILGLTQEEADVILGKVGEEPLVEVKNYTAEEASEKVTFRLLSKAEFDALPNKDKQDYLDAVGEMVEYPSNYEHVRSVLSEGLLQDVYARWINAVQQENKSLSYEWFVLRVLLGATDEQTHQITGQPLESKPWIKRAGLKQVLAVLDASEEARAEAENDTSNLAVNGDAEDESFALVEGDSDVIGLSYWSVAESVKENAELYFTGVTLPEGTEVHENTFLQLPHETIEVAQERALRGIRERLTSGDMILVRPILSNGKETKLGGKVLYDGNNFIHGEVMIQVKGNDVSYIDQIPRPELDTPSDVLQAALDRSFAPPVPQDYEPKLEHSSVLDSRPDLEEKAEQPAEEVKGIIVHTTVPEDDPASIVNDGVISTTAPAEEAQADAAAQAISEGAVLVKPAVVPGENYTVLTGDTLWAIAARAYGDGELWPKIYEANKGLIKEADLIYPDQVFFIPDLSSAG